ncbi:hypothetical protein [Natronococcus sp.]|uniref:hypothetical protein n=1 Tax=Natronococcus sp. TaxID=35747 RepID=UPI0025EDF4F8|nr:hypothetical protein [Natronococcus sp.]
METLLGILTAVTRYDLALGLIPVAIVASVVTSTVTGLGLEQSLVPVALVGVFVIADACYLNPPIDTDDS